MLALAQHGKPHLTFSDQYRIAKAEGNRPITNPRSRPFRFHRGKSLGCDRNTVSAYDIFGPHNRPNFAPCSFPSEKSLHKRKDAFPPATTTVYPGRHHDRGYQLGGETQKPNNRKQGKRQRVRSLKGTGRHNDKETPDTESLGQAQGASSTRDPDPRK